MVEFGPALGLHVHGKLAQPVEIMKNVPFSALLSGLDGSRPGGELDGTFGRLLRSVHALKSCDVLAMQDYMEVALQTRPLPGSEWNCIDLQNAN